MSFHQPKQQPLSFNAFLRPAPKCEETATKELKMKKASEQSLISTQLAAVMGMLTFMLYLCFDWCSPFLFL